MAVRARYLDPNKGARAEANARELSLGGMFIETEAPLEEGALVTIDIESEAQKVTVDARVMKVRAKAEGDKPAGMGVRFLDLPPDVAANLMKVLSASTGRDKTILGVGTPGAAPKAGVAGALRPPGKAEKTVLGIGVPPEALDKAVPKPPLPTRATAPSNPFDAGWEAPPEGSAAAAKDDKAFDKTMDISASEIVEAGDPTPQPVRAPAKKGWTETGAAPLLEEPSAPEGWKWDEASQQEEAPAASAKPAPPKEPPPKKKKEERESSIPPPPKGGGLGWLFWLVVLGGAGGAGYYYREPILALVNPPAAPTASTPVPPKPPGVSDASVLDAEAATDAATSADAAAKDGGAKDAGADAASRDAGAKADAGTKADAGAKADAGHKKP